jgi:uncharacterized delta-60 repeat protein
MRKNLLITLFVFCSSFFATSQNYQKDISFVIGAGFDEPPLCFDVFVNQKIVVGGSFTSLNGIACSKIVVLNEDGSIDTDFQPLGTFFADKMVNKVLLLNDGKLLVAYRILDGGTNFSSGLIRLNPDGSQDNLFQTVTFNRPVNDIALHTDGDYLVCGGFSIVNSIGNQNSIVKINPDGTLDGSFSVGSGSNGESNTLEVLADGTILLAGSFPSFNGNSTYKSIVKLTSTGGFASGFTPGSYYFNRIKDLLIQNDGKIVVVGHFSVNGSLPGSTNRIIRLLEDGTKDITFDVGVGFGGPVDYITQMTDGSLLIGGAFTLYNDQSPANGIISLTSNGLNNTTVHNFGFGFYTGSANQNVLQLKQLSNGKILVLGTFHSYGTPNAFNSPKLIRLFNPALSSESFEDKSKLVFYKDVYTSEYKVNANNQAEITIYSIHGGIQGKQTIVSGENVLNIQHFDKGVYIVRITSDNGEIINTKILKY